MAKNQNKSKTGKNDKMNQTDKDLLFLNVLYYLFYSEKRNINEIVPDFDVTQIKTLCHKVKYFESEESYEQAIKSYANECYNRVKKKFTVHNEGDA